MKPKVYLEKTGIWSKPSMMAHMVYEAMLDEGRSRIKEDYSYFKQWSDKAVRFINNVDYDSEEEVLRLASEHLDIDWGKAPKKGQRDNEDETIHEIVVVSQSQPVNQVVITPVKRGRGRPRKDAAAANQLVKSLERKS